jgi:hypothetical protein
MRRSHCIGGGDGVVSSTEGHRMAQGNQDKGGQGGKGNQGQGGQAEGAKAGSLKARTIPATSLTIERRRPRPARRVGVRNFLRKGPAQPGLSLSRGAKRKLL